MFRVPLLRGLPPEGGEVGRDGERVEDLAILLDELLDLRRVVVGAVLIRPGVDDGVARALQERPEGSPDRVAVGVVGPHHADLLVGRDLRPQMGVGEEELLHAKAVVERPLER